MLFKNVKQYNQAMMDLGAMVCTRGKPRCDTCPLTPYCLAYKQDVVTKYPIAKPRMQLPQRQAFLLLLMNILFFFIFEFLTLINIYLFNLTLFLFLV